MSQRRRRCEEVEANDDRGDEESEAEGQLHFKVTLLAGWAGLHVTQRSVACVGVRKGGLHVTQRGVTGFGVSVGKRIHCGLR
jgi:hypothetical protein